MLLQGPWGFPTHLNNHSGLVINCVVSNGLLFQREEH